MNLSIIIPILNEKKNISLLVSKIALNLKNKKYEIIIIDDSSTDGSEKILLSLSKKKKIRIIFRKKVGFYF